VLIAGVASLAATASYCAATHLRRKSLGSLFGRFASAEGGSAARHAVANPIGAVAAASDPVLFDCDDAAADPSEARGARGARDAASDPVPARLAGARGAATAPPAARGATARVFGYRGAPDAENGPVKILLL